MKFIKNIIFLLVKIIAYIIFPFAYSYEKISTHLFVLIKSEIIALKLKIKGAKVGKKFRVGKNLTIKVGVNTNLIIGDNVYLGDDVFINVKKNATLLIGDNVHVNKGARISSFKNITIKNYVLIASYCNILDHNHKFDLKSPASTKFYDCEAIKLEEGSWLGTKVQVNKGVTVGKYSIVASNSVVTKDIPNSCIYGGVPAIKIKCLEK